MPDLEKLSQNWGARVVAGGRLLKALERVGWRFAASLDDLIISGRELLLAAEPG